MDQDLMDDEPSSPLQRKDNLIPNTRSSDTTTALKSRLQYRPRRLCNPTIVPKACLASMARPWSPSRRRLHTAQSGQRRPKTLTQGTLYPHITHLSQSLPQLVNEPFFRPAPKGVPRRLLHRDQDSAAADSQGSPLVAADPSNGIIFKEDHRMQEQPWDN